MGHRLALLIDAGFVGKRLRARLQRAATPQEFMDESRRGLQRPDLSGHELLRIYVYDAPPAVGTVVNPVDGVQTNLGTTPVHGARKSFHDELELMPDVALRKGELAVRGWRVRSRALDEIAKTGRRLQPEDVEPHLEQKGVDLRIGLDIARLALQRLVDTIVVVTGDSDLVPAFKFARREGLRVYLDHLGGPVKRELKVHVDVVV